VQDRNKLGLVLDELASQQLAEQMVVPVPLAPPVERD
jgi:hypothetical protein